VRAATVKRLPFPDASVAVRIEVVSNEHLLRPGIRVPSMATEQASEQRASHLRSITVTAIAALAGMAAGVVSGVVVGTAPADASDQIGLAIMLGFVVVQLPMFQALGYELDGVKDYLYVIFMTFSLWFITWGILLINNVQL
jgi:hypothetical protein